MRANDRRLTQALLIMSGAIMASSVVFAEARAHEAPTGWQFEISCCSNRDCGQVPASWVSEEADGVHVKPTGEIIPYGDKRLKSAPDGLTYWCRPPGTPNPKTICLYLPGKGS